MTTCTIHGVGSSTVYSFNRNTLHDRVYTCTVIARVFDAYSNSTSAHQIYAN